MPSQVLTNTENNFTKGLLTEFTGLNFPENAATDCDNCIFTLVGDVTRRLGFDYEDNAKLNTINTTGTAINTYKWDNAGGDGETQVIVEQVGSTLYFYTSSAATVLLPLSTQLLISTVNVAQFVAAGAIFDPTVECTFSDGNGYLFVYNGNCDPFYCTYTNGLIIGNPIILQIRDFIGLPEPGTSVNTRPATLTAEHQYNITNQGWTSGNAWSSFSTTTVGVATGNQTFIIDGGISGITGGTNVNVVVGPIGVFPAGEYAMSGSVVEYDIATGVLVLNIFQINQGLAGHAYSYWHIIPTSIGFVNTWVSAEGNYPSNADVWWYFKDNTDVFNPAVTASSVTLATGNAPQGHYLLDAFNQNRSNVASIPNLTTVSTNKRPTNGAWFQGRVWYTGLNATQPAIGDAGFYTWTENIYFSQIITSGDTSDFGSCYQQNDPTSENLFDLLPTDGGIITIQGAGSVYRLFPIANGMLVFAANGVWFITGSQGIGFSANDYTITKISSVRSISSTSFVDVLGLPYFWNEEGIYSVTPSQSGSLTVEPITVGTIQTFYDAIPIQCKQYVRGAYDPINYIIQWVYNNSPDNGNITSRYSFGQTLSLNTYNKAFYPYTLMDGTPAVNGIIYVSSPGGTTAPDPVFKYPTSVNSLSTFSEENNDDYVDWETFDNIGVNFDSFFVTGFKLHGQGLKRFQLSYLNVFSRADTATSYYVQGIWDYATSGNSGRYSTAQLINNWNPNFGMIIRRHRIRGQGLVLQLRFKSAPGQPFDIMGWAAFENMNTGI